MPEEKHIRARVVVAVPGGRVWRSEGGVVVARDSAVGVPLMGERPSAWISFDRVRA